MDRNRAVWHCNGMQGPTFNEQNPVGKGWLNEQPTKSRQPAGVTKVLGAAAHKEPFPVIKDY